MGLTSRSVRQHDANARNRPQKLRQLIITATRLSRCYEWCDRQTRIVGGMRAVSLPQAIMTLSDSVGPYPFHRLLARI